MNMNAMMKQLQQVQKKMVTAQQDLESSVFEGEAGNGKVKVAITGGGDLKSLKIDRSVVDPDDIELLEDLILTAFHQARTQFQQKSGEVMSGLKLPNIPGMGGLL